MLMRLLMGTIVLSFITCSQAVEDELDNEELREYALQNHQNKRSYALDDSKRDSNVNNQLVFRNGRRSFTFDPSHLNLRFGKRAYEYDSTNYLDSRLGRRSTTDGVLDMDDDDRRKKAFSAAYLPGPLADDLALRFGK